MGEVDWARVYRSRWVVGGVVVVVLAALFVNLGLWQLRRWDERKENNVRLEEARNLPVVPFAEALAAAQSDLGGLEHRRVRTDGIWAGGEELEIPLRSRGGAAGSHLLALFELTDGRAVAVDRGWIPLDGARRYEAASGEASITGIVRLPAQGKLLEAAENGDRRRITQVDLAVLADVWQESLLPVYLELTSEIPGGSSPAPVPPESVEPDEGNHFSYAIQWFSFAAIVIVGYGILLYQTARVKRR